MATAPRALPHPPRLLTVDEAAVTLSLSVRHMRRLIAERRIPFVRIGRAVRFDPADLATLIQQSRVEPITTTGVWCHLREVA